MFTGIIQALGHVRAIEPVGGDTRLTIDAGTLDLADVALGDSIAVSGVCLTVVALDSGGFAADVSRETLSCTTLERWQVGSRVNLEKALRLADRLGGHLVSGHVDGVGSVVAVSDDARSQRWDFEAPRALARYIAAKGSIAINGVSLTVNAVDGLRFGVNLIPHTVAMTTFGDLGPGAPVNLEVDMMARYIERLTQPDLSPNA
ncbi:riboflavin synthase [Tahibacter amnicola]|uniref:Riboflavin synthase n=1 Tax=Tahibacter amnicola TaxID=2976241 RepID=A0ABY6BDY1_9GAMM|nr:riboflavin synthase [Tahibacter amnicola]UXI67762.1 riboflavin synthase [Tahibacter amnicola]